jgi:hypothetical protein
MSETALSWKSRFVIVVMPDWYHYEGRKKFNRRWTQISADDVCGKSASICEDLRFENI